MRRVMNEAEVLEVGRDALVVILKTSAPIMIAGMLVGLVVSLFQALTSIQEMTLTFVPKIVVIFIAILVFLPFMMTVTIEFGQRLFDRMIAVG
jgi:flagellar biosynthetic protein FliQ